MLDKMIEWCPFVDVVQRVNPLYHCVERRGNLLKRMTVRSVPSKSLSPVIS